LNGDPVARAVALSGLVCRAADQRTLLEVDELQVAQGERIAIIGHNGSGKTTLLRLLSGFTRPAAGSVEVLGRALADPLPAARLRNLRCEVGQVVQGVPLVARLTALENVLIGSLGRVAGWRGWMRCFPAEEVSRAEAALQAVGLQAHAPRRADRLSGGERQKVAIARLLLQRPRLILADEPTAALDPLAATEICRLLAGAARGATLISVVHNPVLLPLLAERVIGLKQGRVAFDLSLAEVGEQELGALYRAGSAVPPADWRAASQSSSTRIDGVTGFTGNSLASQSWR